MVPVPSQVPRSHAKGTSSGVRLEGISIAIPTFYRLGQATDRDMLRVRQRPRSLPPVIHRFETGIGNPRPDEPGRGFTPSLARAAREPPNALCQAYASALIGRLLLTAEEAAQHRESTDCDAHGDDSHQHHEESFESHKIVIHVLKLPHAPVRKSARGAGEAGCPSSEAGAAPGG